MSRILIVLGMHRSGTSLLAAASECLGVDYGDQLIDPRPDNPKGFWEDREVISLNDALYAVLDGFSSSLGFDEQRLLSTSECIDIQARIEVLISRRLSSGAIFGIKDPRMPRLMGVWSPVVEGRGRHVDYIVPLRNPLSVAASLAVRDGFSIRKGFLLWYEHMYRVLAFSRDRRVVFIDYDGFLGSPLEVLRRIATELRLPLDQGLFDNFSQKVMDRSLRHNSFESVDLYSHPDTFPALCRLYAAFCDLASGAGIRSAAFQERLKEIDEDFSSVWALLKHCGEQDIALWKSWQDHCSERERWMGREGRLTDWTHQLEANARLLRDHIEDLESSRVHQAEEWLREREWFVSEVAGLENMLGDRSSALAWHQSELKRSTLMLDERNSALEWHRTQQQSLALVLEERSSALQWHRSELDRTTMMNEECRSELSQSKSDLERLSALLVDQTAETEYFRTSYQGVLRSTSWRLTAPFRRLRQIFGRHCH